MAANSTLKGLLSDLSGDGIKMGDLKKKAKEIKKNHDFAMGLWKSGKFYPRMLAVLIMDKSQLSEEVIDQLAGDLQRNKEEDRVQIADWLMANQLMKNKKTLAQLESWEKAKWPILRRLFWYHQARLRWMGQEPPGNTAELMDSLESNMEGEEPEVQWAMNFAAGWIGIHEPKYRKQCVALGERLDLYSEEKASRGCTPNYLPEFIRIEAEKRGI